MNIKVHPISYVKQNKYTVCVLILLFVCSFVFRLKSGGVNLASVFFALVNTSFFYLLLDLFVRFRLRALFSIIISFLATADVILFYIYRDTLNYGIAASIFETDESEAFNMLSGMLPLIILTFAVFFILLYKASGEMKRLKRIHPAISLSSLFLGVFVIPACLDMKVYGYTPRVLLEDFEIAPHLSLASYIPVKYPFVTGDIFIYSAYLNEMAKFRASAHREKKLPDDISYDATKKVPTKIVFIIGESALRTHMSLYGYHLKTTPFLDNLASDTTKLSYYDNVISPAGYTRDAIRMSLSFATPFNPQPFLEEKNMINMANDAGYASTWLSSQGKFGVNDSYVGMLAACAMQSTYLQGITRNDHDLLPLLQATLVAQSKQFIVLHLSGSHYHYENRYDKYDTESLGSEGKTIDYDKSIHHTDRLLGMVYQLLENLGDDYLIYYFSDHGELVNEGHGILNRGKDQYRIPLITIKNDSIFNPNKIIQKYYDNETGLLNSSSTVSVFAEMMGYKLSQERIDQAKKDGRSVLQVDGTIRFFEDIPE